MKHIYVKLMLLNSVFFYNKLRLGICFSPHKCFKRTFVSFSSCELYLEGLSFLELCLVLG